MVYEVIRGGISLAVMLGVIYAIIGGVERLQMPGSLARIEQLRQDVRKTSMGNSEDVVGQVTQWNQRIRSMQAYNGTWYAGPVIPDAWDSVKTIPLPGEAQ